MSNTVSLTKYLKKLQLLLNYWKIFFSKFVKDFMSQNFVIATECHQKASSKLQINRWCQREKQNTCPTPQEFFFVIRVGNTTHAKKDE